MTGYSECFFDHVESHCLDNDDDVSDDDEDDVPYSAVKHETSGVSVIFHPWKGLHFKRHSHTHGIHVQYIHQIWLICVVNVGKKKKYTVHGSYGIPGRQTDILTSFGVFYVSTRPQSFQIW